MVNSSRLVVRSARVVVNVIRGSLIGIAEIIPGVSGGTIALIVGVYTTVIHAASSVISGLVGLVRGRGWSQALATWRDARWGVVVPVLIGMLGGIVLGAALLEPVITSNPVETRAVFAGLILASLWVPIRMVGGAWRSRYVVVALVAAGASMVLTGLPVFGTDNPSLLLVAPAAAIAVCALVLPGVSGSFILVVLGMYEPTLAAVNDRDTAYLGVFILGAAVGLGLFVGVLEWLLTHRKTITLVVMTGLMLGSLRALWPWQGEQRELLAPVGDAVGVGLWVLAGAVTVVIVLGVERILQARIPSDAS
jgi:putative membrane protein